MQAGDTVGRMDLQGPGAILIAARAATKTGSAPPWWLSTPLSFAAGALTAIVAGWWKDPRRVRRTTRLLYLDLGLISALCETALEMPGRDGPAALFIFDDPVMMRLRYFVTRSQGEFFRVKTHAGLAAIYELVIRQRSEVVPGPLRRCDSRRLRNGVCCVIARDPTWPFERRSS